MRLLTFSFLRSFKNKLLNVNVMRKLSCETMPTLNSYEKYIEAGEFIELDATWPEKDKGMLKLLQHEMQVLPNFVSESEEQALLDEVEPYLKKMRYEFDHWDDAIHGFKETEWPTSKWRPHNLAVFSRVVSTAFQTEGAGQPLPHQHVLDLAATGEIKPHIDSVRFCGAVIAGLSLLSAAVMHFSHSARPELAFRALLPRRSLYVMSGAVRHEYSHGVAAAAGAFRLAPVRRARRLALLTRSAPPASPARPLASR